MKGEEERNGGRHVTVGIRVNDASSKELLDWTINKVAELDDHIMAVHVCRDSDLKVTSTLSLIRALDECLSVYDDVCRLKQIVLVGRVSRGNSIRKALVKEAKLDDAAVVVVGVNKLLSLGGSASLAKYCAKKLSKTTAVIAVQNGKVVFERKSSNPSSGEEPKPILLNILQPSMGMDAKFSGLSLKFLDDEPENEKEEISDKSTVLINENININQNASSARNLGWPLLRKSESGVTEKKENQLARKMSVVHWVMKLPSRTLPYAAAQHNIIMQLKTILLTNSSNCKWFQYDELDSSTNHFSSENLIGKGGSSQVYKGYLSNGQLVAIKLSKLSSEASKCFLSEVEIITKLNHQRIVSLIGVCVEDTTLISVYNYFPNGSLQENLHRCKTKPLLNWDTRFKVAVGVAEALCYLHDECPIPVIHRDVKSSNILLNEEFDPQVSDFGLALWAPSTSASLTDDDVVGTFGYLAPEYFMYGKVSVKIDVYAFGIVLLELLTGRKPISDDRPKGEESLVMWAKPLLERGNFVEILDPGIEENYDEAQMRRMILAASLCITRTADLRPPISKIRSLLRGDEDIEALTVCHNNGTASMSGCQDEEAYSSSSISSHLGLALLDVEDDASVTSYEQSYLGSMEEYLRDRWSRSSSFD